MRSLKLFSAGLVVCGALFTSCSSEEIDRTDYIDDNSAVVIKLNTNAIVKENIWNALEFAELIEDFDKLDRLSSDSSDFGIEYLAEHYASINIEDGKFSDASFILELKDVTKLEAAITSEGVEITKTEKLSHAVLEDDLTVMWDSKTLIAMAGDGDKVDKLKALFARTHDQNIVESKPMLSNLVEGDDHFSMWMDQGKTSSINAASFAMLGPELSEFMSMDSCYSFINLNFLDGEIKLDQEQIFNSKMKALYTGMQKENSLQKTLAGYAPGKSLGWFSMSWSIDPVIDMISKIDLINQGMQRSSGGLITTEYLKELLSGDMLVSLNDLSQAEKEVPSFVFDEKEGRYVEGTRIKKEPVFDVTFVLGIKDSTVLMNKLGMVLSNMPKDSLGNTMIPNVGQLLIDKDKVILKANTFGEAKSTTKVKAANLTSAYNNPFSMYVDVDGLLGFAAQVAPPMAKEGIAVGSKYLSHIETSDYVFDEASTKSGVKIVFKKDENALLQLSRLALELKKLNKK